MGAARGEPFGSPGIWGIAALAGMPASGPTLHASLEAMRSLYGYPLPAQLRPFLTLAGLLADGAEALLRATARRTLRRPRRRNATVRPGLDTPLWLALVAAVRPHLRRRGSKINLGRELGVPPQRIHEYFVARTAAPDAERTLALLVWLWR